MYKDLLISGSEDEDAVRRTGRVVVVVVVVGLQGRVSHLSDQVVLSCFYELEFHGNSFLVASSSHLRDILADTPDTRNILARLVADILARMSRGRYEDATRKLLPVEFKLGCVCAFEVYLLSLIFGSCSSRF